MSKQTRKSDNQNTLLHWNGAVLLIGECGTVVPRRYTMAHYCVAQMLINKFYSIFSMDYFIRQSQQPFNWNDVFA